MVGFEEIFLNYGLYAAGMDCAAIKEHRMLITILRPWTILIYFVLRRIIYSNPTVSILVPAVHYMA